MRNKKVIELEERILTIEKEMQHALFVLSTKIQVLEKKLVDKKEYFG